MCKCYSTSLKDFPSVSSEISLFQVFSVCVGDTEVLFRTSFHSQMIKEPSFHPIACSCSLLCAVNPATSHNLISYES